jgi:hypothetical protein
MKVKPYVLIFGDWQFGFNLMFTIFFGMIAFKIYTDADQWSVGTIVFLSLSAWNLIRISIRFWKHRLFLLKGKKVVGKVIGVRMMRFAHRYNTFGDSNNNGSLLCTCRYEYIWQKRVYRNKIRFFTDNYFALQEKVRVLVNPQKPNRSILTYPFDRITAKWSMFFELFRIKT